MLPAVPAVILPSVVGARGIGLSVNVYVFPATVILKMVAAAVQVNPNPLKVFVPHILLAITRMVYVAVVRPKMR